MFHPRKRREFFADNAVKILRPLLFEPAQTRIDFHEENVARLESRFDRSRFPGAAKEKRGGRDQRQGESDLHYDQWIAREKSPTRPV